MTPYILIVENDRVDLEDAVTLFKSIHPSDKSKYGISSFKIDRAEWGAKAVELLETAGQSGSTYDIVLLDLELPDKKGGALEDDRGFFLLQKAREQGALDVVIYSAYAGYRNLLRALREGASDFISKASSDIENQTRLLGAWRRAQEKRSDQMMEQRIRQLIPYADRAVGQRFTPYFSSFVQNVVYAVEQIEDYADERYGLSLERDSRDSLVQALTRHKEIVKKAQDQWSLLQSEMFAGGAKLRSETVETLLAKTEEYLQPCLMIKETTLTLPTKGETQVQSFENDIDAVLREIITGTLSELQNHGDQHCIRVEVQVNSEKRRAEVRFLDDLEPLSPEDAKIINEGLNLTGDRKFGRLWGLQIAQQIVMLSGGRLQVQPEPERSSRPGNVITCLIPLA